MMSFLSSPVFDLGIAYGIRGRKVPSFDLQSYMLRLKNCISSRGRVEAFRRGRTGLYVYGRL